MLVVKYSGKILVQRIKLVRVDLPENAELYEISKRGGSSFVCLFR